MKYETFQENAREISLGFLYGCWFRSFYSKICKDRLPTTIPVQSCSYGGGVILSRKKKVLYVNAVSNNADTNMPFPDFFKVNEELTYEEFLERYAKVRDASNAIYRSRNLDAITDLMVRTREKGKDLINCILGVDFPFTTPNPALPQIPNCFNITGDGGAHYKFEVLPDLTLALRWESDPEHKYPDWFTMPGIKVGDIITIEQFDDLATKAVELNHKYFNEKYPSMFKSHKPRV